MGRRRVGRIIVSLNQTGSTQRRNVRAASQLRSCANIATPSGRGQRHRYSHAPQPASVDADGATIEPHDLERNGEAQALRPGSLSSRRTPRTPSRAISSSLTPTPSSSTTKFDSVGVARAIYTDTAGCPLRRVLENDAG